MGIERFYPRMQAAGFVQQDQVLGQPGDSAHTRAIVDGPAFAYFVHHRLKLSKNRDGNSHRGIGADVSYAECAAETLRWLNLLENHGLAIHGVYFDGALPLAKRPTRLRRLKQNAEQLRNFKLRHDNNPAKGSATRTLQPVTQQNLLPEPPFIVPVVRETLLRSAYSDRILVVPGEADNFCVAEASQLNKNDESTKISIFTNDSDLAVFNSGPRTRIVMLHSLAIKDDSTLTASSYWPAKIAKSISQPDLLLLAYHLQQDSNVSVARVQARMEHDKPTTGRAYQEFKYQYSVEIEEIMLGTLQKDANSRLPLLNMDARLAELVCQCRDQANASNEFEVYLPFVNDDPTRASAWHVGSRIRDLAYATVLAHHKRSGTSILEYKRAGDNIAARKISSLDSTSIPVLCRALHTSLQHTLKSTTALSSTETWRYAVVQTMLWSLLEVEGTLPQPAELLHVVLGKPQTVWSQVRLSAQYQACFYSLRMLHQALRYVHCGQNYFTGYDNHEHMAAARLLELLNSLPSIADFFAPCSESADTAEVSTVWLELLTACVHEIGGHEDESADAPRPSKKRKTKELKKASAHPSQATNTTLPSRNTFAMLDT